MKARIFFVCSFVFLILSGVHANPQSDLESALTRAALLVRKHEAPYWPHNQVYFFQLYPQNEKKVSISTLVSYFLENRHLIKDVVPEDYIYLLDIHCRKSDFHEFVTLATKTREVSPYRMHELVPFRNSPRFWDKKNYSPKTILQAGGVCTERSYLAAILLKLQGKPSRMIWGENHFWYSFKENGIWKMSYEEGNDEGMFVHPVSGQATICKPLKKLKMYDSFSLALAPWKEARKGNWQEAYHMTKSLIEANPTDENLQAGLVYPLYFLAKCNEQDEWKNRFAQIGTPYRGIPLSLIEKIVFSSAKSE